MSAPMDWSEVCRRIETVPAASIPMRLELVSWPHPAKPCLRVWTYAADVVGALPPGWHSRDYQIKSCLSFEEQIVYALKVMELEAVHEVREAFVWLGPTGPVRAFDPHAVRP